MTAHPGASRPVAQALAGLRGRLVDLGYAGGWRAVRALPEPVAAGAFRRGADLAARRNRSGTAQLRANLRRVVGPAMTEHDLDDLVRASLRSYSRYWMETFRLPSMAADAIAAGVRADGAEHIDTAMAAGRGAILALPHSGNWDVSGIWLIARGVKFATVAERLEPESLFNRFVRYREGLGMEIIPLSGGKRAPSTILTERLQAGGCVCLLADRDLGASGVPVEFFGEPTRMPPGPALLSATTGAALLPVIPYYTDDGWGHWIGAPIEPPPGRLRDRVAAATQQLADAFASHIAEHPADWHMLQKLWLADLDPSRLRPTESAT